MYDGGRLRPRSANTVSSLTQQPTAGNKARKWGHTNTPRLVVRGSIRVRGGGKNVRVLRTMTGRPAWGSSRVDVRPLLRAYDT